MTTGVFRTELPWSMGIALFFIVQYRVNNMHWLFAGPKNEWVKVKSTSACLENGVYQQYVWWHNLSTETIVWASETNLILYYKWKKNNRIAEEDERTNDVVPKIPSSWASAASSNLESFHFGHKNANDRYYATFVLKLMYVTKLYRIAEKHCANLWPCNLSTFLLNQICFFPRKVSWFMFTWFADHSNTPPTT